MIGIIIAFLIGFIAGIFMGIGGAFVDCRNEYDKKKLHDDIVERLEEMNRR